MEKMTEEEAVIEEFIEKVIANSKDLDPEIADIVAEKFWDCI